MQGLKQKSGACKSHPVRKEGKAGEEPSVEVEFKSQTTRLEEHLAQELQDGQLPRGRQVRQGDNYGRVGCKRSYWLPAIAWIRTGHCRQGLTCGLRFCSGILFLSRKYVLDSTRATCTNSKLYPQLFVFCDWLPHSIRFGCVTSELFEVPCDDCSGKCSHDPISYRCVYSITKSKRLGLAESSKI